DPYMFHQGNLRAFRWPDASSATKRSLVTLWLDHVIDELLRYSTLPVVSIKFDEAARMLRQRMTYDSCGVEARLQIEDEKARGIALRTHAACRVPITGVRANLAPGISHTTY